jgi:hypothetical protein
MIQSRTELESAVLQLPRSEQLELVEAVLRGPSDQAETEAELWWLLEAERRLEAVRAGEMSTRPSSEVFAELLVPKLQLGNTHPRSSASIPAATGMRSRASTMDVPKLELGNE